MIKHSMSRWPMNILLADDDADDRGLFKDAVNLIDETINVFSVKDGEELMTFLDGPSSMPDMIFLDLNMPKKNGRECLVEISANQQLKHVPVIIYSTSLNRIDIEETFTNGAAFFFRKPNSFEELREVLHKLLFTPVVDSFRTRQKEEYVLNGLTGPALILSRKLEY